MSKKQRSIVHVSRFAFLRLSLVAPRLLLPLCTVVGGGSDDDDDDDDYDNDDDDDVLTLLYYLVAHFPEIYRCTSSPW